MNRTFRYVGLCLWLTLSFDFPVGGVENIFQSALTATSCATTLRRVEVIRSYSLTSSRSLRIQVFRFAYLGLGPLPHGDFLGIRSTSLSSHGYSIAQFDIIEYLTDRHAAAPLDVEDEKFWLVSCHLSQRDSHSTTLIFPNTVPVA